jgi:Holliday junction resolvasome RuvABC endonuclease subunit
MKRKRSINKAKGSTILACDPSLTAWGWAIINWDGSVVAHGCIRTEPMHTKQRIRVGDDFTRRIKEIANVLITAIKKHNVNYMVCELPHGSKNAAAAKMVGAVPSIMETISSCFDIGVEWYSEADGKKAVLGSSKGDKETMVRAIKKRFPNIAFKGFKYYDEAVADAMAIYHVASLQSSTMQLLKKVQKNGQ